MSILNYNKFKLMYHIKDENIPKNSGKNNIIIDFDRDNSRKRRMKPILF